MWCAKSVCEIRSSSRHFRIVLPGCSDKAISPAIFSRSGNSMFVREGERYISVSKRLSAYAEARSMSVCVSYNREGLAPSISALTFLRLETGRIQVHLDLGVLRGPEDLRGIELELRLFLPLPRTLIHLDLIHWWTS